MFVGAYEPLTINICVIRDGDQLVVVDSRSSATEGAELAADLTWFAPARVQALINTHAHFDHTFGNQHFGSGDRRCLCRSTAINGCRRISPVLASSPEAWRRGAGNERPGTGTTS